MIETGVIDNEESNKKTVRRVTSVYIIYTIYATHTRLDVY